MSKESESREIGLGALGTLSKVFMAAATAAQFWADPYAAGGGGIRFRNFSY